MDDDVVAEKENIARLSDPAKIKMMGVGRRER
jgi:hypothetical protein